MKAYSEDLRQRVIEFKKQNESNAKVAQRLKVCERTVAGYWKRYKEKGTYAAKKMGGYRRSRLQEHDETLKEWIKEKSDLTLKQLQEKCLKQLNIKIGINALWHRLERLGLSFKKNVTGGRSGTRRCENSS